MKLTRRTTLSMRLAVRLAQMVHRFAVEKSEVIVIRMCKLYRSRMATVVRCNIVRCRWPSAARLGGCLVIVVTASSTMLRADSDEIPPAAVGSGKVVDHGHIHLTKAQEKSLDIQTVKLKTAAVRPLMTLYGELKANPDGVWMLSAPLAGVVLNMPGKQWPQIGTAVIRGSSLAGIKPVVSTTLQITLALELTKVRADLAAARVADLTSGAAYAREKSLYAHNEAVSLQRVQAAQAAFAAARARMRADAQSIAAISRQLKTKAGGFLPLPVFQSGMVTSVLAHPGEAVAADQPLLQIEDFHTLIAAVALPAADSGAVAMGTVIRVRALGHKRWLMAKPLTLGPQVDRQTRGLSALYLIDNARILRPGMAITARMPKAAEAVGMTIIPRSAVVWRRGERWVYLQRGKGVFVLHQLVHPIALSGGFGVRKDTIPSQRVVSNGAQVLMTIQPRAGRVQGGATSDGDDDDCK